MINRKVLDLLSLKIVSILASIMKEFMKVISIQTSQQFAMEKGNWFFHLEDVIVEISFWTKCKDSENSSTHQVDWPIRVNGKAVNSKAKENYSTSAQSTFQNFPLTISTRWLDRRKAMMAIGNIMKGGWKGIWRRDGGFLCLKMVKDSRDSSKKILCTEKVFLRVKMEELKVFGKKVFLFKRNEQLSLRYMIFCYV